MLYRHLMPIATSIGVGYEITQGDLVKVACYGVATLMVSGEVLLNRLENNSNKELEKKV